MIRGFAPPGVPEYWSDGIMEKEKKDFYSFYTPTLQYSNTPILQYSNTPILHISFRRF
jgi:hypothetical protein